MNQPASVDCPLISEYRFFELHSPVDTCLSEIQRFYGRDIFNLATYGYDVKEIQAIGWKFNIIKDSLYQEVAIDIDFLGCSLSTLDFSKFKKLEFLRLRGIEYIPESVFNISGLKVLSIFSKELKIIPDEVIRLENLKVLDIVTGDGVMKATERLGELHNLEILRLCRLYSISSIFIDYSNLINLKRVEFWDNSIELVNPTIISCNNLYYLESKYIKPYFIDLPFLRILAIEEVANKSDLKMLENLDSLQELYIHRYRFDYIYSSISKIKNLRVLSIDMLSPNARINRISLTFPSLQHLTIYGDYIDDFPKFNSPNLEYLNLVMRENKNSLKDASSLLEYKKLRYLYMIVGDNYDGLNLKERNDLKIKILKF